MANKRKEDTIVVDEDEGAANENAGYSWEEEYKRSWDVLQENEDGSLKHIVNNLQQQLKRRRLLRDTGVVQRGIIRHLFIIIDCSNSMLEKDLRPSRLVLSFTYIEAFILEFFDQNPISQLGIITTKNGVAEKISELSGNPLEHIANLKKKANQEVGGEPSLQNSLDLAMSSLAHLPPNASKEIVCIFGSLTTCDPGNLLSTVNKLSRQQFRCSIIGLAAEVRVFKLICDSTQGKYFVPLNENHFKDILFEMTPPPATLTQQNKGKSDLVMMGFPKQNADSTPTYCACHQTLVQKGYICPRCQSKVCSLPTNCVVCNLTLISSPHLARSYHHLFPVDNFVELDVAQIKQPRCYGCQENFDIKPGYIPPPKVSRSRKSSTVSSLPNHNGNSSNIFTSSNHFQCKKCLYEFCIDCDLFIHEELHTCPGCS